MQSQPEELVMGEDSMFTDSVNYKTLATRLRGDGHTAVPDKEVLLETAKEVGGVRLASWVLGQLEGNEGNFFGKLAFNMMEAGETAS